MDHAISSSPAVQAQLDRLTLLSPGADILGLSRITELLHRLGDPHLRLPPTFHVAGTNGKGSTCAFLRAALEAEGYCVHAYTSPHLVRFNERIRVAGTLIDDAALAPLLARVLDVGGDVGASFFEVTTAAAFLIFAEVPAAACVIEVGLGGRLDATNVLVDPAACGIAQLGIDHQAFLGDSATGIACEKAGIAKPGRPLATLAYLPDIAAAVAQVADAASAPTLIAGRDWHIGASGYRDARGEVDLPPPRLAGDYQRSNLALAVAMLRHQDRLNISSRSLAAAALAEWPARLQLLKPGPLTAPLGSTPIWLDGGHNPAAALAVAEAFAATLPPGGAHLVLGMLANKDAAGFLAPFAGIAASLTAVPIPGHEHHPPQRLADIARDLGIASSIAPDLPTALGALANQPSRPVAILGSLYLAGEALALNDELPD